VAVQGATGKEKRAEAYRNNQGGKIGYCGAACNLPHLYQKVILNDRVREKEPFRIFL